MQRWIQRAQQLVHGIHKNGHPKDIYNLTEEDINQLLRRIDHLINFDDPSHAQALGNTNTNALVSAKCRNIQSSHNIANRFIYNRSLKE
jgi:hypothetical protein